MTDSYQLTALQLSFLYFSRKPLRKSYISFECISFMVEMLALDIICPLDCLRPPNTYHSLIKDASSSSCSLDTDARSCSLKSQASYRLTSCITHLNIWSGLVWSGLIWSDLVWSGLIWSGLVWSGLIWSGLVWQQSTK